MARTMLGAPRELGGGLQYIPASATDFSTKTCYIKQIYMFNKHTAALTVTITDKSATPFTIFLTPLEAKQAVLLVFPDGIKMTGGVVWSAGTGDLVSAEVFGYVAP